MRFLPFAAAAALSLLSACDEAAMTPNLEFADDPDPAAAFAASAAAEQAEELSILAGRDYGGGLVLLGGATEGNQVTERFEAPIASTARPGDLGAIRQAARSNVAASFCATPSTAAAIAQGVVFEIVTNASDGAEIDRFPLAVCL